MHDHSKQVPQGIYRDVALYPLGFLACIETALPPFCTVFTDWESRMATRGSAFWP